MHPCLSHILTTNLFSHTTLNPLFVRWGVSHTLPKKKKGRTGLAASEHLLGLDGATPPGLLYLYISFGYDCRARSLLPRWAWVSHTLVGPLTPTQKKKHLSLLYPLPVPGYHSVGTARPQHGWGARCFGTKEWPCHPPQKGLHCPLSLFLRSVPPASRAFGVIRVHAFL